MPARTNSPQSACAPSTRSVRRRTGAATSFVPAAWRAPDGGKRVWRWSIAEVETRSTMRTDQLGKLRKPRIAARIYSKCADAKHAITHVQRRGSPWRCRSRYGVLFHCLGRREIYLQFQGAPCPTAHALSRCRASTVSPSLHLAICKAGEPTMRAPCNCRRSFTLTYWEQHWARYLRAPSTVCVAVPLRFWRELDRAFAHHQPSAFDIACPPTSDFRHPLAGCGT